MIYIPCPHCGHRNADEFIYGGDNDQRRPENPEEFSDAAWCEYIYTVPNVKGITREYWRHKRGCNRWFVIQRDSRTDKMTPLDGKSIDD